MDGRSRRQKERSAEKPEMTDDLKRFIERVKNSDPLGYDRRLREALRDGPRPMTMRQFVSELQHMYPHLRGTSYGGVREYLEGNVMNPRTDLLHAMADVLGVRREWLSEGLGARTVAEEAAAGHIAEKAREESDDTLLPDMTPVEDAFREGFPYYRHFDQVAHASVWSLWHTLMDLEQVRADYQEDEPSSESFEEVGVSCGRKIANALRLSLEALDLEGPEPGRYLEGMLHFPEIEDPSAEQKRKFAAELNQRHNDRAYIDALNHYVVDFCQGASVLMRGQKSALTTRSADTRARDTKEADDGEEA